MFKIKTQKVLSEQNIKRIIAMGLSLKDKLEEVEKELITDYDSTKTYSPDMACYYNDYLYRCLFTTTGEFDINSWEKVGDSLELVNKAQVEAMLGLTPDELDTLANIILDSEVRLDKTWSSSKIYESVQEAIRQNKKFTLEEFAKANKASYTVADSVDTMTDQSTIYLLKNDTTYDMYIVQVDGTSTKIGDVNIDLTQYVKTTELNSHIEDKSVHFENQAEKDSMLTRDDIVTTIDNTVTNEQIPSAKAVYDSCIKDSVKIYTHVKQLGLDNGCSVGDIFNAMPVNSLVEMACHTMEWSDDEGASYVTDVPEPYVLLTIRKYISDTTSRFTIIAKRSNRDSLAPNIMWIGQLKGFDGTGLTWSRVCTTNIADVSKTNFDLDSESSSVYLKGDTNIDNNWFSVVNGWCFVQVDLMCKLEGQGYKLLYSSLPKPIGNIANGIIGTEASIKEGEKPLQVTVSSQGVMKANGGKLNTRYIGNFSYPVMG